MQVGGRGGTRWDGSTWLNSDWGVKWSRFKSCQPDTIYAVQMLYLSVTEVANAGALDSVSTTARNRRIFAWLKTGFELRVSFRIRPAHGGTQLRANCDTQVG
jgi:hypothetical protein